MIQSSDSKFIKLYNDDNSYNIRPEIWNLNTCVDGDYNSMSITYKSTTCDEFQHSEFFSIETEQFIVDKCTVSNYEISMENDSYSPTMVEVKLLIHFHSPIIKDVDKYRKLRNRQRVIKKILDNK